MARVIIKRSPSSGGETATDGGTDGSMAESEASEASDDSGAAGSDELAENYKDGERLFDIARRAGLDVETACVGKGTCGLCRVRILAGEEFLDPYTEAEEKHLGNVYYLTKIRLSCRTTVQGGDVTIELPQRRKRKQKRSPSIPPGDRRRGS